MLYWKSYLQIKGCSIGTIGAPAYMNIHEPFWRIYLPIFKRIHRLYILSMDRKQNPANNVLKRLEYKAQLNKVWMQDIAVKYPFFWHGSLYQKQQTIHEDLSERYRQTNFFLHINLDTPYHWTTGYPVSSFKSKPTCWTIENFKLYCSELK